MPLKNILVHFDSSRQAAARLNLAVNLAQKHQARVTALYIVTHQYYEPQHANAEARTASVQAGFNAVIEGSGVAAELLIVDWQVTGVVVSEIINSHAHYSDLVIIGQADPKCQDDGIQADLPERVIIGAGRPVLIIPYTAAYKEFGKRALVAWKSGRESTRAVNDAIPLLSMADSVNVLVVNSADSDKSDGERLCSHLACHSINAKAEQTTAVGISIGDVLLNRASTESSDLLVMGAYAHKRLGTAPIGDVAKHILKHMTLPVLMSH
jgi:nucleotide-binding universal stress UspA family protein